jgi:hypothetical protein
MIGMWVVFFALLFAGRLDELWSAIRDFPLVLQIVLWVVFLPWMLGTAVWTSSWGEGPRVLLVVCFAVGWTLISIPRRRKA